MTDKEIYEFLLNDQNNENLVMTDDDGKTFEMAQMGTLPMHGVIYAVLDLLKIDGQSVSDEESGIVLLELDYDEESDEYYVSTIEDDELFDEVMKAFDELPIE